MEQVECIHGMNPEWCANCKGLKTPEEEQAALDSQIDEFIRRVNPDVPRS